MSASDRVRLIEAWGLSDTAHPEFPGDVPAADPEALAAPNVPSAYDRDRWRKKLALILDGLPDSEPEWSDFIADADALGLDRDWVQSSLREEFRMLIRRVVSDARITPLEHRKLDLARSLTAINDDEALAILNEVVAEAETFFGKPIEDN
jgi:hypothetical protein